MHRMLRTKQQPHSLRKRPFYSPIYLLTMRIVLTHERQIHLKILWKDLSNIKTQKPQIKNPDLSNLGNTQPLFKTFTKKLFLHDIALRNQLSMIFTDFLHMFTFFKLVGRYRKIFFGKSDFFPKILNFCCIGLPPAETYWMIMSPQKRVKKIPTICTCQTFIYYVN